MEDLMNNLEKRSKSLKIAAFVCLGLFVALLGFAILGGSGSNKEAKSFIYDEIKTGDYVYLDVDGVSDCICYYGSNEYDSDSIKYYDAITVTESGGVHNCVILSDAQFKKLSLQNEYMYSEDYPANKPETVRLYGTVKKAVDGVVDYFKDFYGLTEEEYHYYFGDYMFNATITPGDSKMGLLIFGSIISLLSFVALIIIAANAKKTAKTCLANLTEAELMKAQEEYAAIGNARGVNITENFLLCISDGIILKLEDIKWVYKHVFSYGLLIKICSIKINTEFLKNLSVQTTTSDELLNSLVESVAKKNPEVIVGYSKEAREAFKNLTK